MLMIDVDSGQMSLDRIREDANLKGKSSTYIPISSLWQTHGKPCSVLLLQCEWFHGAPASMNVDGELRLRVLVSGDKF